MSRRGAPAAPRLTECGYMGDAEAVLPAMRALCADPLLTDPAIQARPCPPPPPSPRHSPFSSAHSGGGGPRGGGRKEREREIDR